jgi:hypothetical protein
MLVSELVKKLKKVDQELPVLVFLEHITTTGVVIPSSVEVDEYLGCLIVADKY